MDWSQAILGAFIAFSGYLTAHLPTIGALAYEFATRWLDAKYPPAVAPKGQEMKQ